MATTNRSRTRGTDYAGVSKATLVATRGKAISSAYPLNSYADPDGFVVQAGTVLERYDERVIIAVTDPTDPRSVQRQYPKFPPTVGQIADACEEVAAYQHKLRLQAQQPKLVRYVPAPVDRTPGCRARVFVGDDMPFYEVAKAWAESPDADPLDWRFGDLRGKPGIWIALSIWENVVRPGASPRLDKTWKSPSDAELRAKYGRREAEAAKAAQSGESA